MQVIYQNFKIFAAVCSIASSFTSRLTYVFFHFASPCPRWNSQAASITPSIESFSALINACGRIGDATTADKWKDVMRAAGLEPDEVGYTAAVAIFTARGGSLKAKAYRAPGASTSTTPIVSPPTAPLPVSPGGGQGAGYGYVAWSDASAGQQVVCISFPAAHSLIRPLLLQSQQQ